MLKDLNILKHVNILKKEKMYICMMYDLNLCVSGQVCVFLEKLMKKC